MDSELKAKWIDALESGAFHWGQYALYEPTTGCHCALGVLAAIMGAAPHTNPNPKVKRRGGFRFDGVQYTDSPACVSEMLMNTHGLPAQVLEKIGMTDDDEYHVSGLNDTSPTKSYAEAIRYIKENL